MSITKLFVVFLFGFSTAAKADCYIRQEPILVEALVTYPYLGTRSYRVKYWEGSVEERSGYWEERRFSRRWVDTSIIHALENSNLDERIDNEKLLRHMSRKEMRQEWQRLLDRCGYEN